MNNSEIDFKVNQIRELNIKHPSLADALNTIQIAYLSVRKQRSMNEGKIPSSYKPTCGVITGPTGVGKTTLCNFVKTNLPSTVVTKNNLHKKIIPCIYVSIANMSTPKSVTGRILEEFDQEVPNRATEHQMLRQLKELFTTCETNLVLLDEIHDIVTGTGLTKVMSWLKSLVNETKAAIFLAGTEDSEAIVDANPELKTRFKMRMRLHYMRFDLDNPDSEFEMYIRKLLLDIERILEFTTVFTPNPTELARLYLTTDGNLENISTLMIEASRYAMKAEQTSLTFENIREGFHKTGLTLPVRYQNSISPFELSEKDVMKSIRHLGSK